MGYFANGSEGDNFQARWCDKCVNWKDDGDGPGCVIWDLHMLWNYEQHEDETKRLALDTLIQGNGRGGWKCNMFNDGKRGTPAKQRETQREQRRIENHPWVQAAEERKKDNE